MVVEFICVLVELKRHIPTLNVLVFQTDRTFYFSLVLKKSYLAFQTHIIGTEATHLESGLV